MEYALWMQTGWNPDRCAWVNSEKTLPDLKHVGTGYHGSIHGTLTGITWMLDATFLL